MADEIDVLSETSENPYSERKTIRRLFFANAVKQSQFKKHALIFWTSFHNFADHMGKTEASGFNFLLMVNDDYSSQKD